MSHSRPAHILFHLTGSIAAYKACEVISRLRQLGHEVKVTATPAALQFVTAVTLEGLSGQPVLSNIFQSAQVMDHIALNRWADLAIVCPASAQSINAMAAGTGSDPLISFYLAFELDKKPFLIAPAMNHVMWRHPSTQSSLKTLLQHGVQILPVAEGHQACGETGAGRLLEPQEILRQIQAALRFEPFMPASALTLSPNMESHPL